MKKFKNFVLSLLFGRFIEEKVEKSVSELSATVSTIKNQLTPEKIQEVVDPSLIKFPEKGVSLRIKGEGKDEKTFLVSRPCWEDGVSEWFVSFPPQKWVYYWSYFDGHGTKQSSNIEIFTSLKKFVEKIFGTNCIAKIDAENAFHFKLTKSGAQTWDEVTPKVLDAIASLFMDVPQDENVPETVKEEAESNS